MNVSRRPLTLLSLWTFSLMCIYCQDNITFSPDRAPCVGDRIEMVCSIVPPTSETFGALIADVSINGSTDFTFSQLNSNDVIDGIDLSRYSANTDGLNPSTTMSVIRLIINSYLPQDSYTTFQCVTTFLNGSDYLSTVSGSPMTQEPVSLSDTNANISFQILENSKISVTAILLSQIERNETLNYTYTLDYDTSSEISSPTQDDSYTFVQEFTCDVCYRVSYSAENCAGGSGTISSGYFELQNVLTTTGNFILSSSDPIHIEWNYDELLCSNNNKMNIEENYLPEDYFTISLVNRETSESFDVSNSSVDLPYGFSGDIPEGIDLATNTYNLSITFIDSCFDFSIQIGTAPGKESTLTIVLGVFFALLLVLL